MERKRKYDRLPAELEQRILQDRQAHAENPFACRDEDCLRRQKLEKDQATLVRPAFVRDIEKIVNTPYYPRYADKTQVFSLKKNDDISRRFFHVQLVARIAKNLGRLLNLNLDLIEAIALGHDMGHTPFGHAGEKILGGLYHGQTGRYFNHNIQSARILDTIFSVNASLQTLDGIICHNGETEQEKYYPQPCRGFEDFDEKMRLGLCEEKGILKLVPCTLEGCVVRISDIIAYLGKDRQDAIKIGAVSGYDRFEDGLIGSTNAEIINNVTVNLVENSYGKNALIMSPDYYREFSEMKKENYELIYLDDERTKIFDRQIAPMFEALYFRLLKDLTEGKKDSVIFTHHLRYVAERGKYYPHLTPYEEQAPDDIVTDYIASMTDDYLIDLYRYLFPKGKYDVKYQGYFE